MFTGGNTLFDTEMTSDVPELDLLLEEGWISDVLYELKSGKEATAWCCAGGRLSNVEFIAAKVYRPIDQRGFRNDAVYQAGRADGMKRRERMAFEGKSRFGLKVRFSTWVEHEFRTLDLAHKAGTRVPRPITKTNDVILMEFIGDEDGPAPPLHTIRFSPGEAQHHLDGLLRDIGTWLKLHRVHGDLSAYNILYWQDELVTIDFPQAVDPQSNPNARDLLERDIHNVCKFFGRFGARSDPGAIAADLWTSYRFGGLE
jgi:RIO kinase 1